MAGRDRRADEGARPVRRHRLARVWRARPAGHDLRPDRDQDLLGVDGDHRHLQLAPDAGIGGREIWHRAAETALAAEVRDRRDPRRAGAHRAQCRHRPAGDPHDRAARQGRLCDQRHQDLDQQRHRGPLFCAAGEDQPRGEPALFRHEPVHRAQGAGLHHRAQAREAGLQVDRFGRADLPGLPHPGRPPDRRGRGPRLHPGGGRIGARPHQRGGARSGHRRRRSASGDRLCATAPDLRQADHRAPGDRLEDRRDGHARPCSTSSDARRRPGVRPRRPLRHGGRHGQVLCLGSGAGECHGVQAHPRRLRLLQGIRHRAALSRRAAHLHWRGYQRDAAPDHRPAVGQAERLGMNKPLEGIRVLTLEQFGAGPYCTMFMAELGAEVIKIEAPDGGDPSRQVGPHLLGQDDSEYFQAWNLGKKSVTIDLKSKEGRRQFEALVKTADCVVNNMRGTQPEKLGIDYASLGPIKPSIVCLHISAYGRANERKDWPGYDFLMQAEAGLMELTGEPDGPPTRVGVSMIDSMSGLTGIVGLLACLLRAKMTGQGCDVETCLYDVAMHQLTYPGVWYLNEGDVSPRVSRSAHLSLAPVQTFPTKDGWIFIMCMTQKFWLSLCTALGRAELAKDSRFPDPNTRACNRAELTDELDGTFRTRTTADWLARFNGLLPAAPVYRLDQALDSDFAKSAGMVSAVPHPVKGTLRVIANPIKVDGERMAQAACSPLGADNDALLGKQS